MKSTKKLKKEQIFPMVVIGLLAIIFSISTASAADIYVNTTGNDETGDGSDLLPYLTIEKGIKTAVYGDTIKIGLGTYTGTGNKNITIDKNLEIIGAGMNKTIIDAGGTSKVFTIEGVQVLIKDLTIQNAKNSFPLNGTGETMDDLGGAINNKYGVLEVENVKFINNKGHKGAAIANTGELTVSNSIFSNNQDNEWGGAIMNMGTLIVTKSTFSSNWGGTEGGAIFNSGEATITDSTFENNYSGNLDVGAPGKGGAIFSVNMFSDNKLTANNNRFLNNRMLDSDPSFFLPGSSGPVFNDIYIDSQYSYTSINDISKNWWGQSTGPKAGQYYKFSNNGTLIYEPYLTSDPNGGDTTLPTVTATPKGGTYSGSQSVVLTPSESASIYYTTNGTAPTKSSNKYTGPINISKTTTLKFKAWDTAGNEGATYTETYTIGSVPKPDIRVENVITKGNTVTGVNNYSVSSTVKNYGGSTTKEFYVSYYLSKDSSKSSDDKYIGHATLNGLNSGSSFNAQILATIPKDIAQGNYYIIAVADVTGAIDESNEANNVKSSSNSIFVWRPDLRVKSVTTNGNTATGANYVVSSIVENNGGVTGKTFYVSYYLSTDASKSSDDRYIGHKTLEGIPGWSTTKAEITATIPKDIAQGNYYIIAVADVTGEVPESIESNNVMVSSSKIFVWRPDLKVKSVTAVKGATDYSVSSIIENGGSKAKDAFDVYYYISKDATISSDDLKISTTLSGLEGWSTTSVSATFTIPADIASGNYYIIAVVDPKGAVLESNEANNVRVTATPIKIS